MRHGSNLQARSSCSQELLAHEMAEKNREEQIQKDDDCCHPQDDLIQRDGLARLLPVSQII